MDPIRLTALLNFNLGRLVLVGSVERCNDCIELLFRRVADNGKAQLAQIVVTATEPRSVLFYRNISINRRFRVALSEYPIVGTLSQCTFRYINGFEIRTILELIETAKRFESIWKRDTFDSCSCKCIGVD